MDDLTYSYDSGNKLTKVADAAPIDQFGFKDDAVNTAADTSNDYTYDANGNMKTDANKGITGISYNHLNLPTTVNIGGGTITYMYDATGVKQKKIVSTGTTTDYAGNYIYENNTLQFFNHPEGYVQHKSGIFSYVYQYKDHLGNIRLSYSDANDDGEITVSSNPNTNEIIEESNYYPFGLRHKGYNNFVNPNGNSTAQKRKFGGMEYQDELGLEWYDITARNYDPALGRWMNLDPLAEQMRRHSPYNYAFDNPVYFIDPDGMKPHGPGNPILKMLAKYAKKGIKYVAKNSKGRFKPVSKQQAEKLLSNKQSVFVTGKGKSKNAKKLFRSANPDKRMARHDGHLIKNKQKQQTKKVGLPHHQKASGDGSHAFYDATKAVVATTAAVASSTETNASTGSVETSNTTDSSSSGSITSSSTMDSILDFSNSFLSFFDNLGSSIFGKDTEAAEVANELNPLNLGASEILKPLFDKDKKKDKKKENKE